MTVLRTPPPRHGCNLVQPVIAGIQTGETWAPVGTIERCDDCGRIWLAEPPIRVSRGQQSSANRWVQISTRRARRLVKRTARRG